MKPKFTPEQITAGVDAIRRVIRERGMDDHDLYQMGEDGESRAANRITIAVYKAFLSQEKKP